MTAESQAPPQVEREDGREVGVLFVDLLFALVVVELLEPLRDPSRVTAEGWVQLSVAFFLTLLSWIGYHLSVGRVDSPIRVFNPPLLHLLLDVLMVAAYWLTAISYERVGEPHSWWFFPNPSAVPEALFVSFAFLLYVCWDHVAEWIHNSWAIRTNARLDRKDSPYRTQVEQWDTAYLTRARRRRWPTRICLLLSVVILAIAIAAQEGAEKDQRNWVIGLDISLIALLIGFRTGKEWVSYGNRWNGLTTCVCGALFLLGVAVPLILSRL